MPKQPQTQPSRTGSDGPQKVTVRLDRAMYRSLRIKLASSGQTVQGLMESAVREFLKKETKH